MARIVALRTGASLFFLRVGFLFQAAFWIVVVSFLLTGGDYERALHAKGFAAPARQTAGRIVEAVASLRTICDDHRKLCRQTQATADTIGHWTNATSHQISTAWDWSSARFKPFAGKD